MAVTVVQLPDSIAIEHVDALSLEADADFWRIYDESFPASERDSRTVVLATAAEGAGFALRIRRHQTTIGLLVAHMLRNPAVIFIVYLAVDPQWRAHRLGSTLLEAAETLGSRLFEAEGQTGQGMVWEIDDPSDAVDADERVIRLRRRRFFERAGGHALDVPYLQPPIDGHSIVPMQLMHKSSDAATIPPPGARKLVRAIYDQKYRAMNGIPGSALAELLRRSGN